MNGQQPKSATKTKILACASSLLRACWPESTRQSEFASVVKLDLVSQNQLGSPSSLCCHVRAVRVFLCCHVRAVRVPYVAMLGQSEFPLLLCQVNPNLPLLPWQGSPSSLCCHVKAVRVSLCCHVRACGPDVAAALRAFRADCYLKRSDWMKLLW